MFKFLQKLFQASPETRLENARLDMEHAQSMMGYARNNSYMHTKYATQYAKARTAYFNALHDMGILAKAGA